MIDTSEYQVLTIRLILRKCDHMLHGDISNQRSFAFGFRCEGSLLQYKDEKLSDKFMNLFSGKTHRAKVNESILALMRYLYWNTEYTVMLVIDDENYTDEAKEFLDDFPFNQIRNIRSISQVTMMLNTGEKNYYIDDCDESRYKVQSKYAITSEECNSLLKRHYGRLT